METDKIKTLKEQRKTTIRDLEAEAVEKKQPTRGGILK